MNICLAESDDDIRRCFAVMRELRTGLLEAEFVPRVRCQQRAGYQLVFVERDGAVMAVAGFRLLESLSSGRFVYVDDLVSDSRHRSKGFGQALFDWLVSHARSLGCDNLELDSGVQRHGAHRFYLRNRMEISSHHFRRPLSKPASGEPQKP